MTTPHTPSQSGKRKKIILAAALALVLAIMAGVGSYAYNAHNKRVAAIDAYMASVESYTAAKADLAPALAEAKAAEKSLRDYKPGIMTGNTLDQLTHSVEEKTSGDPSVLTLDTDSATTEELTQATDVLAVATDELTKLAASLRAEAVNLAEKEQSMRIDKVRFALENKMNDGRRAVDAARRAYDNSAGKVDDKVRADLKTAADALDKQLQDRGNWRLESVQDYEKKAADVEKAVADLEAKTKIVADATSERNVQDERQRFANELGTASGATDTAPTHSSGTGYTHSDTPAWAPSAAPAASNSATGTAPTPAPSTPQGGGWVIEESWDDSCSWTTSDGGSGGC